jgi:predicted Zn-dependent protease
VNLKEINAFALPGGAMFVQRGMFDAAGRRTARPATAFAKRHFD